MREIASGSPVRAWLLAITIAVGLAFADASIVVLALPRIFGKFDITIVSVSWVLTGYAIVVAAAAFVIAAGHRRIRPVAITAAGLVTFAIASWSAASQPRSGGSWWAAACRASARRSCSPARSLC